VPEPDAEWPQNYFNYFTEIEEHFQRVRGTSLFLLSPLDWALIESWKGAGVPLAAVLRGIDQAFEKYRAKKVRTQIINSLSFCSQAVLTEAENMAKGATGQPEVQGAASQPFSPEELRDYLAGNAEAVRRAGHEETADTLDRLAAEEHHDLEQLEIRLTALEQKLIARLMSQRDEEELFQIRQELERQLRGHRGKMSAAQLSMLERQFLERSLLDRAKLPRLSLFYLGHS
jgi:hypothetical protein